MKNILFLLILFFSCYGNSQTISLNQGTIATKNYYTEVAFEFVKDKIIIPVEIEGKTYRFILDTGAPLCITKTLDNIINPTKMQSIEVTDANNIKSDMNLVQVPTLEIGGVIFNNSVSVTLDDDNNMFFDCFQIDGFIGSNLLRNSILQIDTKRKIIRITNDSKKLYFNKKNGIKVTLVGKQSSPYIWLGMRDKVGIREQVLIDTGMSGFYDMSSKKYEVLKNYDVIKVINNGSGSSSIGLFGNSNHNEQLRLYIPEILIANTQFQNINTITHDDTNSRIGIDLFDHGIGTLDYKKKKFYFDDFSQGSIDMKQDLIGFSPTILDNKLAIGIVWDENLKEKMKSGDEIIEVNGMSFENYKICDLLTKKSILKGIAITEIIIKTREGEIKKIEL